MSDQSNKSGGGAGDLLSKLFEMDEDVSPAPNKINFSEDTKIDHPVSASGQSKSPPLPVIDPEPKKSLADMLKTGVGPAPQAANRPSANSGDDLFKGILEEDPTSNETLNLFAGATSSAELPLSPTAGKKEISDKTEVLQKKSAQQREKTILLDQPASEDDTHMETIELSSAETAQPPDPIEAALSDYAHQTGDQDGGGEKVSKVNVSKPREVSVKPIKSQTSQVESLSADEFSEGFSHKPIQVSESNSDQLSSWKTYGRQWILAGGVGIALLAVVVGGFLKIRSDAGFLGYHLDGVSLMPAYKPPSESQISEFKKKFEMAADARRSDDPKKIEEVISALKSILTIDERNLEAAATVIEHSAILTVWYGLKSPWPQQYDEATQKLNNIFEKVKTTSPSAPFERAKAWKILAFGESKKAFSELLDSANKFPADQEIPALLVELAYLSGNKTEAEKWNSKISAKAGVRLQKIRALLKNEFGVIQELAAAGYLPAKIEDLTHQTIRKETAEKLLIRSDSLLEETKTFSPLASELDGFRGDLFYFLDEAPKAQEAWKRVVERSPNDSSTWIKLAKSYEDGTDWDSAIAAYREAAKSKGLSEEGLLRYAKILRTRGKMLDAISVIDEALKTNPKSALLHYEKGMIQILIYQEDEARASFEKALSIDSTLELATLGLAGLSIQRKEWAEAEKLLNKIPLSSSHHSEALQSLAHIARNRFQFDQAEKFTSKAISENPRLESAYPELVSLYLTDEKDEPAISLVKGGLEVLPRSPLLKVAMARIYQFQGNFEKALTELESARKNYIHIPVVAYAVADILIDNKEISQAYEILNPLTQSDIKDPELQYLRAKAFTHDSEQNRGVGSNEGAYRAIEMAVRKNGDDIRYRVLAAQLALLLQDKSMAIEHIETVLKFKPHNAQALIVRGDIYRDSGDYERATQTYLDALKSTRFHAPIYSRIADGLRAQGKSALAIQYYEKVVQVNPSDARAHLELGKLYSDDGR
ncbi:MAG: hypothetical protein JWQ35_2604, partial [Bacteriovoracaceae bacterium]|nr:hypothetical protein [Bacteriovoracaceae bacterium]